VERYRKSGTKKERREKWKDKNKKGMQKEKLKCGEK
jgi:hypothetical protein